MKVFLDDLRDCPTGWYQTFTALGTIDILCEYKDQITHLSLDHDLGDYSRLPEPKSDVFYKGFRFPGDDWTGYDVLCFLEFFPEFAPKNIQVHSANPVGRKKMLAAIEGINRRLAQ